MSKALGTDDSVTTCDCCGRSNLKFTVIIELDSGEIAHYGQFCAGRNTGKNSRTLTSEIKAHQLARRVAAQQQYRRHPAYQAERARFAERDALPWDDPRRLGVQAAEFVRDACRAAEAACNEIAAHFKVSAWEVRA